MLTIITLLLRSDKRVLEMKTMFSKCLYINIYKLNSNRQRENVGFIYLESVGLIYTHKY